MTEVTNYADGLNLSGRGIVVLGSGGGGIGSETCRALAQAGANLLCVDFRQEEADEAAQATGGTAHVADITSRADMEALFARADALFGNSFSGVVDIVGIAQTGPIPSFDDDSIQRQFDTVFRHALLATQIAAPMLVKRGGGSMVFVGSVSGLRSVRNQALYGMAKAALHHLVVHAALEFGPDNVRFNGIAPGFVRTPRLDSLVAEETWREIDARTPLCRAAQPSDIARAALYLASDASQYVTGNIMTLDGGWSSTVEAPSIKSRKLGERSAQNYGEGD